MLKRYLSETRSGIKVDKDSVAAEFVGQEDCSDLTVDDFQKVEKIVYNILKEFTCQRGCIGLAFDSDSKSILTLYPCIVGAIVAEFTPFCIDTLQQPWSWIEEALLEIGIKHIICDERSLAKVTSGKSDLIERIDAAGAKLFLLSIDLRTAQFQDDEHVAYAIQTSGTTGRRKTVYVGDSSILPNIRDFVKAFKLTSSDRIAAASPSTFDPFYLDVLCSYCTGATLILLQTSLKSNPTKLLDAISSCRPSFMQMTPTLWNSMRPDIESYLLSEDNSFRNLVLGGEAFPRLPESLRECRKTRFFNAYGVTEMSVWQSLIEVPKHLFGQEVPIWCESESLLSDTVLSLSENGEIIVTSSTRRCRSSESGGWPGLEYVIKTGDLGRSSVNDGRRTFFAGRRRDCLKLHGKRFTLEEMEIAIVKIHPGQTHCACLQAKNGDILAFVCAAKEDFDSEKLLLKLPSFLRPLNVIFVSTMPMTPHGKVDKKRLLELYGSLTPTSRSLEQSWLDLTGRQPKPESRFLSDGGDSFLAVRLLGQAEQFIGYSSPALLDLILTASFSDIAREVQRLKDSEERQCKRKLDASLGRCPSEKGKITKYALSVMVKGVSYGDILRSLKLPKNPHLSISWKINFEKCIDASPVLVYGEGRSTVYLGSHSGMLAAVCARDGTLKWSARLPDRLEATCAMAGDGRRLFVGCYDGKMYCVSTTDGATAWSYKTSGAIKCTPAVVAHDFVLFGSYDKVLHCVSQRLGSLVWKKEEFGSVLAQPQLVDGGLAVIVATLGGSISKVS